MFNVHLLDHQVELDAAKVDLRRLRRERALVLSRPAGSLDRPRAGDQTRLEVGVQRKRVVILQFDILLHAETCLLYTSPSPRDQRGSRMPSSA